MNKLPTRGDKVLLEDKIYTVSTISSKGVTMIKDCVLETRYKNVPRVTLPVNCMEYSEKYRCYKVV